MYLSYPLKFHRHLLSLSILEDYKLYAIYWSINHQKKKKHAEEQLEVPKINGETKANFQLKLIQGTGIASYADSANVRAEV